MDSKLNGIGRKIDLNLNIYRGTFKNSKKHGFGILDRIMDKSRYEGTFQKGVEHGYGREFIYKKRKLDRGSVVKQNGSFEVSNLSMSLSMNLAKSQEFGQSTQKKYKHEEN